MSVPKKSNSTAVTGSAVGPPEIMAASLRPAAGDVGRRVIATSLLSSARDVHRRDEPPDATRAGPCGVLGSGRALPPLPHGDPPRPRATPRHGPGGRGGLPDVP